MSDLTRTYRRWGGDIGGGQGGKQPVVGRMEMVTKQKAEVEDKVEMTTEDTVRYVICCFSGPEEHNNSGSSLPFLSIGKQVGLWL